MKLLLTIRIPLLLGFILMAIQSAAFADMLSYNSDQMRRCGNCIPAEELDYQLSAEYELGERVFSTAFQGSDAVLAIGRSGKLHRCDLITGEQSIVSDLEIEHTGLYLNPIIYPVNERRILVAVPILGCLFFIGNEGDIIWEKHYGIISSPIIRDDEILLISRAGWPNQDAEINRLVRISFSGTETVLFEWYYKLGGLIWEARDLVCYLPTLGPPYIFDWDAQSFSFCLFNKRWLRDISSSDSIMDQENRLIFWGDNDNESLVILAPGEAEPEFYQTEFLGRRKTGLAMASNGRSIAMLTIDESNVARIDRINDGGRVNAVDLEIPAPIPLGYYTLYCNSYCNQFIILSPTELAVVDGENWNKVVSDDELQPRSVSFSGDFSKMAVGTESGILYVLD